MAISCFWTQAYRNCLVSLSACGLSEYPAAVEFVRLYPYSLRAKALRMAFVGTESYLGEHSNGIDSFQSRPCCK